MTPSYIPTSWQFQGCSHSLLSDSPLLRSEMLQVSCTHQERWGFQDLAAKPPVKIMSGVFYKLNFYIPSFNLFSGYALYNWIILL